MSAIATLAHAVQLTAGTIAAERRWTKRRVGNCINLAGLLRHRLPVAAAAIAAEASLLDGYPSTASGADRGGGGRSASSSSSTERTALARTATVTGNVDDLIEYLSNAFGFAKAAADATDDRDHCDDLVRLCETALSKALGIVDRYHPREATPRCVGTGGAAGSTCEQVPMVRIRDDGSTSTAGRCVDCERVVERKERATAERKRYHDERKAG